MPKERKNLQVSLEAFKRLKKLNQNTGMSFIDLIDSLTGVDNDLETKQKEQSDIAAMKAAERRHLKSGLPIKEWVQQELSGTRKYAPVDKPDSVIIDCAILSCWDAEYIAMIERQLTEVYTEDLMHRYRLDIKNQVTYKMKNGWSELYPKWFEDYDKHLSQFEITLNGRLKALVKANLLISDSTGIYKLADILAGYGIDVIHRKQRFMDDYEGTTDASPIETKDDWDAYRDKEAKKHWEIINGINRIKPNPTMKLFKTRSGIKNLLDVG